jgi:hypothetical protein
MIMSAWIVGGEFTLGKREVHIMSRLLGGRLRGLLTKAAQSANSNSGARLQGLFPRSG